MENDDIKQTKETENYKTLTFDADYYQGFLDDADIPDEQKREFLETLWNIMVQFVDMGFGIHPLQQTDAGKNTNLHPAITKMIKDTVNQDRTASETKQKERSNT